MKKIDNPVIPTVNINGTDGNELLNGYRVALDKIQDLAAHLRRIAPHGRDFQLAPDTFIGARANHWKILESVEEIENHITKIAIGINNQL